MLTGLDPVATDTQMTSSTKMKGAAIRNVSMMNCLTWSQVKSAASLKSDGEGSPTTDSYVEEKGFVIRVPVVGARVAIATGPIVGAALGDAVGRLDGGFVGDTGATVVGALLGPEVGEIVRSVDGLLVGPKEGD